MAYGDEGTTLANFDSLYPGDAERLNHIFAEQVYSCDAEYGKRLISALSIEF